MLGMLDPRCGSKPAREHFRGQVNDGRAEFFALPDLGRTQLAALKLTHGQLPDRRPILIATSHVIYGAGHSIPSF
jgi:hypothetical protein